MLTGFALNLLPAVCVVGWLVGWFLQYDFYCGNFYPPTAVLSDWTYHLEKKKKNGTT